MVAGCGTRSSGVYERDAAPLHPPDLSQIKDAIPRTEPRSRGGNSATYTVFGRTYRVLASSEGFLERGIASWYGTKFHGRRTANGEIYDMYAMTAAHKQLPIPTYVRVSNLENGKAIVVRVNDRGPFHANRVIDLSYAAAYKLGMLERGTAKVEVQAVDPRDLSPSPPTRLSGMFLQAGAFSNQDNATRLRRRLERDLAHGVRIQTDGSDTRLFRVQVGPVATVAQIDALAVQLERLGISDTHVVLE